MAKPFLRGPIERNHWNCEDWFQSASASVSFQGLFGWVFIFIWIACLKFWAWWLDWV